MGSGELLQIGVRILHLARALQQYDRTGGPICLSSDSQDSYVDKT